MHHHHQLYLVIFSHEGEEFAIPIRLADHHGDTYGTYEYRPIFSFLFQRTGETSHALIKHGDHINVHEKHRFRPGQDSMDGNDQTELFSFG